MTRSACRRCKGSARARSTCPPCAAPQLAPRASSGRARRLRAAQHSQGEAGPPGALPRPRLLEPAATEAADSTAFFLVHTGKAKGSIFDALEDLDYQECLDKCVAISKA